MVATVLVTDPPIHQTGSFTAFWHDAPQGWVFASDIGAVAAAVLGEGPAKHGGANYWLSTEVLTGPEVVYMQLAVAGELQLQTVVRDDVLTVLGRPGTTMAQWARANLGTVS